MTDILAIADRYTPEIVRLRRDFHKHPELSFQEERTAGVVRDYLARLGLPITQPAGRHGLWADLQVPGATRTLALRADMDALAMDERATPGKEDFVSVHPGVAHCCGHDAHMAMLLVASRLLAEGRVKAQHNLRFLFQHAEERAPGGAADLIGAGCLDGVDEVYGLHVVPSLPSGRFVVVDGPTMAAADEVRLLVQGRGGHAAMPHLVVDPVVGAAQVVLALQTLVSRRISPLASLVVSVSSIRGGSGTTNVIPDQVELLGTVRTLSAEVWQEVPRWLEETARSAAASAGCTITLDYRRGYPVLVNDRAATERARASVRTVFGDAALVADAQPWMAAEDFARYAGERPACYVFLGVGNTARGIVSPNHATDFDVDESLLHRGTAWFVALAAGD